MFCPPPMSTAPSPTHARQPPPRLLPAQSLENEISSPLTVGTSEDRPLIAFVPITSSTSTDDDASMPSPVGIAPRATSVRFPLDSTDSPSQAHTASPLGRVRDSFGEDSLLVSPTTDNIYSSSSHHDASSTFPLLYLKPEEFVRIVKEKRRKTMAKYAEEQQQRCAPPPPPAVATNTTTSNVRSGNDDATDKPAQPRPPLPPQCIRETPQENGITVSSAPSPRKAAMSSSRLSVEVGSSGVAFELPSFGSTPHRPSPSPASSRSGVAQHLGASVCRVGSTASACASSFSLPRSAFANDIDFVTDALRRFCVTDDDEVDYVKGTWRRKV